MLVQTKFCFKITKGRLGKIELKIPTGSVGLLMYLKWFFYLVIATYQIRITNLFLKLSIDIFMNQYRFSSGN